MFLFFFVCDGNDMNDFFLFHAWGQLLIQRMLYMSFPRDSTRDVMHRRFDRLTSMSRASRKLILLDHGWESNSRPSYF